MDLVATGLLSAAEAEELHAMETTAANPSHDGYHHLEEEEVTMFGSRRVARRTGRRTARRVSRRR
jgi:hypothetical protein